MNYADHPVVGRYAIEPGMSTASVLRRLKNGQQAPLHLLVPESRTMSRLAAQLSAKLMLDSAEIAEALYDSAFCAAQGYDTATIACLFVPNTYDVYWNTSLDRFIERMQKEHDSASGTLGERGVHLGQHHRRRDSQPAGEANGGRNVPEPPSPAYASAGRPHHQVCHEAFRIEAYLSRHAGY